jgi:hypothetical protein
MKACVILQKVTFELSGRENFMDYLFFASNSICFGFIVLLLFWRMSHRFSGLLLRHWIISILSGVVFYLLNQMIFSKIAILYFLINAAVPLLMIVLLFILMWPDEHYE